MLNYKLILTFLGLVVLLTIVIIAVIRTVGGIVVSHSIKKLSKSIHNRENMEKDIAKSENMYINVMKMNNGKDNVELEEPNYNRKEIVGIVKPIGRFTSMIMGQKVTYMMQHADELKKMNDPSYHKVMMSAHDKTAGRGAVRG
jgi:hypothetical protein